jgi:hypothetical protein
VPPLNLAAEFEAAGESYVEVDADGNTVERHPPRYGRDPAAPSETRAVTSQGHDDGPRPEDGPYSNEEMRALFAALTRFAEHELDQFSNWRLPTAYGEVYVKITRRLPDEERGHYDPVAPDMPLHGD